MKVYIKQLFDITYIIHKASIMREKQENNKKPKQLTASMQNGEKPLIIH